MLTWKQSVHMCLCEIRVRSIWMLLCLHDTLDHLCQYRPPWFTREGTLWVYAPQPTHWAFPLLLSMHHGSFSPPTAQRSFSTERPKQRHKAMKPRAALMHVEEPRGELAHFCTNQSLSLATALSAVKNYTSKELFKWIKHAEQKVLEMSLQYIRMLNYITTRQKGSLMNLKICQGGTGQQNSQVPSGGLGEERGWGGG